MCLPLSLCVPLWVRKKRPPPPALCTRTGPPPGAISRALVQLGELLDALKVVLDAPSTDRSVVANVPNPVARIPMGPLLAVRGGRDRYPFSPEHSSRAAMPMVLGTASECNAQATSEHPLLVQPCAVGHGVAGGAEGGRGGRGAGHPEALPGGRRPGVRPALPRVRVHVEHHAAPQASCCRAAPSPSSAVRLLVRSASLSM